MTTPLDSPRALWRAMTWADRSICALIFGTSLVAAFAVRASSPDARARAIVLVAGTEKAELPLEQNAVATFSGAEGPITVEVRDGAVAVTRSTCAQHVCVAAGWKHRSGDMIACVPNELLVRVAAGGRGRDTAGSDAAAERSSEASRPDAVAR